MHHQLDPGCGSLEILKVPSFTLCYIQDLVLVGLLPFGVINANSYHLQARGTQVCVEQDGEEVLPSDGRSDNALFAQNSRGDSEVREHGRARAKVDKDILEVAGSKAGIGRVGVHFQCC
jgi:hypothetical protein